MKHPALCLAAAFILLLAGCTAAPVPAASDAAPAPVAEAAAVTPVPAATPAPTPTPAATPAPAAPFAIAWMSDTQGYTSGSYDVLTSMFDWVSAQEEGERILALVHTGDFVEDIRSDAQWNRVRDAASVLPADMLCISAPGNHDIGTKGLEPENFLRYRFDTQLDPKKEFAGGVCRYATLESGGLKLLILSVGYMHEAESADWAREVLAAHPDHYGILIAHSYLTQSPLEMKQGYTGGGAILRDKVVIPSPNLHMVLCGHIISALRPLACDDDGDGAADRTVHQFMLNFQDSTLPERTGFMRLIRFDPVADCITITTYSPYADVLGYKGDPLGDVYTIENAGLGAYGA